MVFGVSLQEYMIYWAGLIVIGVGAVVVALVTWVRSMVHRGRRDRE